VTVPPPSHTHTHIQGLLDFEGKRAIAVEILKAELKSRNLLSTPERVDLFLGYIAPLIKDDNPEAPLVVTEENRYVLGCVCVCVCVCGGG
jgi:hypothetical protein